MADGCTLFRHVTQQIRHSRLQARQRVQCQHRMCRCGLDSQSTNESCLEVRKRHEQSLHPVLLPLYWFPLITKLTDFNASWFWTVRPQLKMHWSSFIFIYQIINYKLLRHFYMCILIILTVICIKRWHLIKCFHCMGSPWHKAIRSQQYSYYHAGTDDESN